MKTKQFVKLSLGTVFIFAFMAIIFYLGANTVLQKSGAFTSDFDGSIKILETRPIEGGIEILARAWDGNGEQIGFGPDGSVDIERFKIYNPPVFVPDQTGTVVREYVNSITNEKKFVHYRENQKEALLQVLGRAINVKKNRYGSEHIVFEKVGNTTFVFYPAASPTTPVDGYVSQDGPGNVWAGIRDGIGNGANDTSATALQGIWGGSNNGHIGRYIFLFDTSPLPDVGSVTAGTLSLYVVTKGEAYPDTRSYFNVVRPATASMSSLVPEDYDSFVGLPGQMVTGSSGKDISDDIILNAYNNWALNATGLSWVSPTSITSLGLAEGHDIENVEPVTGLQDNTENWMTVHMADFVGTVNDPMLVVEHSAPPFTEVLEVRKTNSQSDNNVTVTVENDNELVLSLKANTTFIIDGALFAVAPNGTPDIQISFVGQTGSNLLLGYTNDVSESVLSLGEVSPRIQLQGNVETSIHVRGTIITGGTSGDFRLQWSQATPNTNNPTTVLEGSYLRADEI